MGYTTRFELTVLGADYDEVTTELEDIVGHDPLEDSGRWDEHEEHMQSLAKRFPGAVLVLSGEGEENADIWRMYFMHGVEPVTQRAKICFDKAPDWAIAAGANP